MALSQWDHKINQKNRDLLRQLKIRSQIAQRYLNTVTIRNKRERMVAINPTKSHLLTIKNFIPNLRAIINLTCNKQFIFAIYILQNNTITHLNSFININHININRNSKFRSAILIKKSTIIIMIDMKLMKKSSN